MKALSIQQPWAWLIVSGHKNIENRKWYTNERGEIYVHSGKKIDMEGYWWVRSNFPLIDMPLPQDFETGGLVGKTTIEGCVKNSISKWFFGPYGFELKNSKPVKFIPYRGQLGFFNIQL